jgi:deazaflavin-dependent oxidoreductase (nitroreductase family)
LLLEQRSKQTRQLVFLLAGATTCGGSRCSGFLRESAMARDSKTGLQSMATQATVFQPGRRAGANLVEAPARQASAYFLRPSFIARIVNRLYGWITTIGFGLPNSYILQISGRKTGKVRSVPVNVLSYNGKLFLVATRGHTHWSRNALATRYIMLKRGRLRTEFRLRVVLDAEKPKILKAYANRFHRMAGRFFPLSASAPSSAFAPIAARYPVFELIRI